MGMRIDETGEQRMAAQIDDAGTGRDGKIGTHVDDALAFNADNRPRDRLGADTIDQTIGLNDD